MEKTEKIELVNKAIQNDELDKLFLGKDGYKWGNLKHIPADVPTDVSEIIKILYELYQNGNTDISELLKNTICKLADGNAVEIWTAYSIIWSQYYNEMKQKSPLSLISDELLSYIRTAISESAHLLSNCYEYTGKTLENGLLDDITISNESIKRKFNVSIL